MISRTPILPCLLALAATPLFGAVSITISPTTVGLRPAEAKFFQSAVSGAANTGAKFYVNGIQGGTPTLGTIDIYGIYTAPAVRPAASVSVKAVSVADPTKSVIATVSLLNPIPVFNDLQPRVVNSGVPVTLKATGEKFVSGAQIYWGATPLPTTFISANEVRATHAPAEITETLVAVTIKNPNPGAADSWPQAIMVAPPITVSMYPTSGTVQLGSTLTFQSAVYNTLDPTLGVKWSVNGIVGGNATVGTISGAGVYTAPALLPTPNTVQVRTTSIQDPRAFAAATLTLVNAPLVVTGVGGGTLTTATTTFKINGTGFARNASATLGERPLTITFVSPTQLTVTGAVIKPSVGGYAVLKVTNPDPGGSVSTPVGIPVENAPAVLSYSAAFRFLEQASWGPTPDSIARVRQIGRDAWITEQFNTPASTYVDNVPANSGLSSLQSQFMCNAVNGPDQLRQRVAFALSQIFVVSGNKLIYHQQNAPYHRMLLTYAFGNFRDLLREVSLSPTMGGYLDVVNNEKPSVAYGLPVVPNENYARELMQLFSLGLPKLNPDGSAVPGVSAYTETDVKQLALALTGWTYPPVPGVATTWPNPEYYAGKMVAVESRHDTTAKTLLGTSLPGGQAARQDLDAALDVIFNHPNVGPFVSYRLIQRQVTGNPSKAYVARVAAVFGNNGLGVRGDMKAVIRAILMDPEAATADGAVLPADQGHLREPILYVTSLIRNLGGALPDNNNMSYVAEDMGQKLFSPPSVFNYFSPFYRIPGFSVTGPEFQILNASTVVPRADFAFLITHGGYGPAIPVQIECFDELGEDVPVLLEAISKALLGGRMQTDMKTSLTNAIAGLPDPKLRARTALYLVASHARYQSQR